MARFEIGIMDVVLIVIGTWAFYTLVKLIVREVTKWDRVNRKRGAK